MAVAAQIQRNFLPREEPRLEGFEICGGNRGCYQIGGDYYDFIPLDDGRLGMAIADVSGCGVGPSLLMASLRASLHAELGARTNVTALAVAPQRLRPQELGKPHVHHLLLRHPGRGGGRDDLRQRGPHTPRSSSRPAAACDGWRARASASACSPASTTARGASASPRATCSVSSPTASPRDGRPTGRISARSASSRSFGRTPALRRRAVMAKVFDEVRDFTGLRRSLRRHDHRPGPEVRLMEPRWTS